MKKTLLFFVGVLVSISSYSQSVLHVFEDWSTTSGTQNFFHKNVTKTDLSNNVYVAGATMNGAGNYDILVAKYNSSGTTMWTQQINGDANIGDFATALFVTDSGDVVVTGTITNDTTTLLSDMFTLKLNGSSGVIEWIETFDAGGSGYDIGTALAVGDSGYVYIGGSGMNASYDMDVVVLKYSSTGTLKWSTVYDYNAGNDAVVNLFIGKYVYITAAGERSTGSSSYDGLVLEIKAGDGSIVTNFSTGSTAINVDIINDGARDVDGNLYITGAISTVSNGYDTYLLKLDSNLVFQWDVTYDGSSNLDDVATGMKVDKGTGNIYISGYSTTLGQGKDWIVIGYDSTGTRLYYTDYNDTLNGDDEATSLEIDNDGNIIVTGYDSTHLNNKDYYTIKYDSTLTEIWSIRADGDAHIDDRATNIAIDTTGNVIVTGESRKIDGSLEYKTVKYIEHDVITPTDYSSEEPKEEFLFYENRGQLINTDSTLIPSVKYYTHSTYPALYFRKNSYSLVFGSVDTIASSQDTLQRIDVTFNQVNSNARTYSLEEKSEYFNYFLGHCPDGITEVKGNQRLVTTNLYTNIDLISYSNQAGFKYYFIVKPSGNPANIQMEYTGASSFNLDVTSNELTISSLFGDMVYDRPIVYQLTTSNVVDSISGWTADWQTNGASNKYKFNLGAYDTTKTLVFLVKTAGAVACTGVNSYKNIRLSSYYASTYWDRKRTTKVAPSTEVYYGGNSSHPDFPATVGPLTTVYGDQTGTLSKFNNYGTRQWATFIGGNNFDDVNGIAVNILNQPIIVGTTSSPDFPQEYTGNQYGQGYSGGDGFITRFASSGFPLLWSTYFGGTGSDALNQVTMATGGNDAPGPCMYVVGRGTEASPYVTRAGAYNSPTSPSGDKGLIARFDYQDSLTWSTFIGTEIRDITTSGNILLGIGGYVSNNALPWKYSGGAYIDSTLDGSSDAFIAILDNFVDTINWATYYGGDRLDMVNGVAFDNSVEGLPPNLYAVGQTGSSGNTTNTFSTYNPGGWAYYDSIFSGQRDAVMWKFSSTGHRLWTSYYGTGSQATSSEELYDVLIDKYNNVYFCGSTASQLENVSFMGTSNWYNQNYTSAISQYQAFLFGIKSSNLTLFWATNFGGNYSEYGEGLSYDAYNDYLYMTGFSTTQSNGFGFPAYRPTGFTGWYVCEHLPTTSQGDGYFAQFDISDAILTGINEQTTQENENSLISYPNPFTNEITFNFSVEDSKGYTIEIYNTLGQLVYTETEPSGISKVSKTINLDLVNNGMYFVQIKLTNRILAGKILRQN